MQSVRVLIADDQPRVVADAQKQLRAEPWITLVGVAPSFPAAAEWLAREPVDVVIFGLLGMGEDPVTGVQRMRSTAPQIRLVVWSSQIQDANALLAEGVLGYITKTERSHVMLDAIRSVMRGERYCSPTVVEYLEQRTGPLRITADERRVLELLSQGVHDSAELAEHLGVQRSAVNRHLNALRNKLRLLSREELAAWYQHHGARLTPEGTLEPITDVKA